MKNSSLSEAANIAKRIAERRIAMNRRREKGVIEYYIPCQKAPEKNNIASHYMKKG